MTNHFKVARYTEADKYIEIYGPNDLILKVDFDDVNHEDVELDIRHMIHILNTYWGVETY